MAKAIYMLKLHLFRDQVILLESEREAILNFCQFLIRVYIKAWFLSPLVTAAPSIDLNLLKLLESSKCINYGIAVAVLAKHLLHLWYLSETLICLALFDRDTTNEAKAELAHAILNSSVPANKLKRAVVTSVNDNLSLSSFVTKGSIEFFKILSIPTDFLSTDPSSWSSNKDYVDGLNVVLSLKVVNDGAERGVALASEYNRQLTKDEDQKQCLLRSVHDHRQKNPSCSKSKLFAK